MIWLFRDKMIKMRKSEPTARMKKIAEVIKTCETWLMKPFLAVYEDLFLKWQPAAFYILVNYVGQFFCIMHNHRIWLFVFFDLLPRLIIACSLLFDAYNLHFEYFYKMLPLYIIPMIYYLLVRMAQDHACRIHKRFEGAISFFIPKELPYWILEQQSKIVFWDVNPPYHLSEEENKDFTEQIEIHNAIYFTTELLKRQRTESPLLMKLNKIPYTLLAFGWGYIIMRIILQV